MRNTLRLSSWQRLTTALIQTGDWYPCYVEVYESADQFKPGSRIRRYLQERFRRYWDKERKRDRKLISFYNSCKPEFGTEKYVQLPYQNYERSVAAIRMSIHLPACELPIEDENHCLFDCSFYSDIRTIYVVDGVQSETASCLKNYLRTLSQLSCLINWQRLF